MEIGQSLLQAEHRNLSRAGSERGALGGHRAARAGSAGDMELLFPEFVRTSPRGTNDMLSTALAGTRLPFIQKHPTQSCVCSV